MSNLRWLEREGKIVLQQKNALDFWDDIPTVKEPRKAREFNVGFYHDGSAWIMCLSGDKNLTRGQTITVREIIETEGG